MLANGIKLMYKASSATEFINLEGLKEVPEIGDEKERVENTGIAATNKEYEYGIGDLGELEYKFKYENKTASSPYRVLRQAAADNEVLSFKEVYPDGTSFAYDAMVSVKLGGGAVNNPVEFTVKMAIQNAMTVTDPE